MVVGTGKARESEGERHEGEKICKVEIKMGLGGWRVKVNSSRERGCISVNIGRGGLKYRRAEEGWSWKPEM